MQRLHLAPTPLRLIPAGQKGNEAPQGSQLLGWLHEVETEVSKLFPSGPNRAPGTGRAAGAMEEAACALFSPEGAQKGLGASPHVLQATTATGSVSESPLRSEQGQERLFSASQEPQCRPGPAPQPEPALRVAEPRALQQVDRQAGNVHTRGQMKPQMDAPSSWGVDSASVY